MDIYVEQGKKKTLVGAIDWPGWCRNGRDEAAALQAFIKYEARYAGVMQLGEIAWGEETAVGPAGVGNLVVQERVEGNSSTDFGGPGVVLAADELPLSEAEFTQWQAILQTCWLALDEAIIKAEGKELRKGPRGGGRDLPKLVDHIIGADKSYLNRIATKYKRAKDMTPFAELPLVREAILAGIHTAQRDGLPEKGPRGGKIWPLRAYFRRAAWHTLDHVWEIEDRLI